MKLTGERPIEGETPDSLLALHAAGYREVRARVGSGKMLDLGCGLGDGTVGFAAEDRMLVGVDYDQETASSAVRLHLAVASAHRVQRLAPCCRCGPPAFDDVCSSHLIEHFVDPEFHVAEVARVLADDGRAFFLTPNKPADFENPYHVYLFDPDDLAAMLVRHYAQVTVLGLDASPDGEDRPRARRTCWSTPSTLAIEAGATTVVLDFGEVTFVNSTGLGPWWRPPSGSDQLGGDLVLRRPGVLRREPSALATTGLLDRLTIDRCAAMTAPTGPLRAVASVDPGAGRHRAAAARSAPRRLPQVGDLGQADSWSWSMPRRLPGSSALLLGPARGRVGAATSWGRVSK